MCLYVRTGKNLGVCVVGRGVERGEGCMMHSVCNMSDASGGGVIGKVQMSLAAHSSIHNTQSPRNPENAHLISSLSSPPYVARCGTLVYHHFIVKPALYIQHIRHGVWTDY